MLFQIKKQVLVENKLNELSKKKKKKKIINKSTNIRFDK